MVTVSLTQAPFAGNPGGEVVRLEGVALFIDTRPQIHLLKADGSRERIVSRHLIESTVWIGLGGTRLDAPVLQGDDLVVHFGDQVLPYEGYIDSPIGFSVVGDTLLLTRTESPVGCERVFLQYGLWRHGEHYLSPSAKEVMIAPRTFVLEDLAFRGGLVKKRRSRLSVLAD
jgi:hypothetical protein